MRDARRVRRPGRRGRLPRRRRVLGGAPPPVAVVPHVGEDGPRVQPSLAGAPQNPVVRGQPRVHVRRAEVLVVQVALIGRLWGI